VVSQADLLLSALDRVGAVADVASDSEGEVTTDGAYVTGQDLQTATEC